MEEIIEEVYNNVETYTTRPVYGVKVNKSGCKLVIEIEGSLDYGFTENNGESMMLPLNPMLLKSGKQIAIIKVYPLDSDSLLTKEAHVGLRFTFAPDKESGINEYTTIASFSLPEDIGTRKLPYFEVRIPFEVEVPFDYSLELENAKDLKSIYNIEGLVVAKYNQLRDLCLDFDEIEYLKERIHSSIIVFNTLYDVTKDDITKGYETKFALTDSEGYNRKIFPIENYVMQYYANGKIVALWQKNKNPMLYVKSNYKYTSGKEASFEGGDPIYLYIPEGSNDLKIWQ
ncbi:hypothetical protein J2Q11_13440 [Tenacibaculum finnmarkense genomovar finnmarkense]|uniref:hypothetical protein n=1 Tax=Tenacibaculum finnmarkense TaxID=2781243 RepID=UPI001E4917AB|nr:hypothetical protein [Tenacibaculum finnmarkense]MCD8418662.1 hypothetical protein [Tenacibaculum finnmarkense genomovar finnmarkense]MCG8187022.1 hypothetical protein [Tenacibaculum finnmarkense genomovar finnmarkense]MCG8203545.1 hypothetical protein [Tenacibaculum finnmarkense genomovar finnmarkense]MCG8211050.1 hypothetical protein [Tenacibaculum finnmarkense genomovar finnmarkense]MCG8213795.1 hypothetical protein [Tenacibaculum finnmarkense genomovar finnmarkense]